MNLKEFEITFRDARHKVMIETLCKIDTLYIGHEDYMDIKSDLRLVQGLHAYNEFNKLSENGPDFFLLGIPGYVLRRKHHFGYSIQPL